MPAFHELDVPLTAGQAAAMSPTRIPAAVVHVNPWATGAKGTPLVTIGNPGNQASAGIVMSVQRPSSALINAPFELILGDLSGAWVMNLADLEAITAVIGAQISLIYMP